MSPCYASFSGPLRVRYTLEAELFTGKRASRVRFKGVKDEPSHVVEEEISIASQSDTCTEFSHIVYVKVSSVAAVVLLRARSMGMPTAVRLSLV